jgi:hypothetical protein
MRVIKSIEQTDEEWQKGLPDQPFDMYFFVEVLQKMFAKRAILDNVLAGQDLAQASGWDV